MNRFSAAQRNDGLPQTCKKTDKCDIENAGGNTFI